MLIPQAVPYTPIQHPFLLQKGVQLTVKRLDLVHGEVSGNKFFKLQYNLQEAIAQGYPRILTFGGAYSNHIHATAAACHLMGLESIGIIRGEQSSPLNPTLRFAQEKGMQLHYWDRSKYRNKRQPELLQELQDTFGKVYIVPEGGTNALAIQGTAEILGSEDTQYSHIFTAIGTGGTFAGLAASLESHQTLFGVSALKGDFMVKEIQDLLQKHDVLVKGTYQVLVDYHFGGYAKWTHELLELIRAFNRTYQHPLDPIYTGKMMAAILGEVEKGHIPAGSHVLAIHTGGLQGVKGFEESTGESLG
ncbi:1-aminocyclopropane-1-carboxylate deaminase/D-cysteine desulfhydrase [Mongoliitalea daihaiensis]|uniref:1-aminocyclopropane-1-carboxylate deaminase/D-cysteine desulfhydrase n=1 Tax=Mongoliitalea daihaiensis TaxID=2782006 RepID=UPI001F23158F|nr:pyridoxal-phosphate dependent enzyme [Mongoliitalea daihaiensis]UJP66362.1 1-aminocyclopropane-1-carboxylate deaminase/D-cysteine desulfhydrase [Mongoliitalea daihaiensis]